MLDILRRHASSWGIKVILGAIIITFVFFFGYSAMRRGGRGGGGAVVARVDGAPIPAAEFEFFYDRNFENLRSSFKDKEIPDFARKLVMNNSLEQMVARELILIEARKLGVVIPDEELADVIRQSQEAQQGGEFDPIFYRHQFLPYFKNRYGLDYEDFVRQDLKIEAFRDLFATVDSKPPIMRWGEKGGTDTTWTFEMVVIDPKAMADAKTIKNEEEAKGKAYEIITLPYNKWKGHLKRFNLKSERIGPIRISDRRQLMEGRGEFEDYKKIFTLTKEKPLVEEPIQLGDKLYVVRLMEVKEEESLTPPRNPLRQFFHAWMSKLQVNAKVESYLENP